MSYFLKMAQKTLKSAFGSEAQTTLPPQKTPPKQPQQRAQERFDYYKNHPSALPDADVLSSIAGSHVVLIVGWGAPFVKAEEKLLAMKEEKRYFGYFKNILEANGATVSIDYPRSETIGGSAKKLINRIPDLYHKGGNKPLVLLGHSRGGLVAVKTLMEAPDLLRDGIVKKAVTLQSPVNGSNDGITAKFLTRVGIGWATPDGNFGLKALETKYIERAVGAPVLQQLSPEDRALVSSSVVWLAGSTEAPKGVVGPAMAALVRKNKEGPNDTMVALCDQRRLDYGVTGGYFNDIGHLEAVIANNTPDVKLKNRALAMTIMEVMAKNAEDLCKMAPVENARIDDAMSLACASKPKRGLKKLWYRRRT